MKNIEFKLESVDFSVFSKVQSRLKDNLLREYDQIYANKGIEAFRLTDDELDMVVAAGIDFQVSKPKSE